MKCENLFQIVESLNEKYMQFLTDICTIESPTDYKEGVDRVGQYFADKAAEKGWIVEVQQQEISGNAMCITMNADAPGAPICFSGHMDTVHPVGAFGEVPVTHDDEKIYGPGIADCKGGLAASFMAMDALERYGYKDRPVKLILQSDEENGSRNSKKTTVKFMAEKAKGCIAFLNTEPGRRSGHAISMKGICKFRFEITGKAAHSSACYNGISAICEAAQKIIRLEQYKDKDSITCNCGLIKGGSAENTVPEHCTFTADFRFQTEEQREKIMQIVQEVSATSFVEGTTCSYVLASHRCALVKTPQNVELFQKVRQIYLDNGLGDVEMYEANGGADSADMTQMGITCLESAGVFGGKIHNLGEFIYHDSLIVAAKRLSAIAACLK